GGGRRPHHARAGGHQTPDRARRGGRAGGVPLLASGVVHHRRLDDDGRRVERALTRGGAPMAASATAFLGLLAREAPTIEFEGPVLEARTAGASPAVVEELEQARIVALRVRALLERRRRREAELTALFDTASDLALLHDLDSVLEAIVRRARTLLD